MVTNAIKSVQGQMGHLNKSKKALLQDIKENKCKEQEETLKSNKLPMGFSDLMYDATITIDREGKIH